MDWPPYSPDLNPIAHAWDKLGRRLQSNHAPTTNHAHSARMLVEEWQAMPQDFFHRRVNSVKRRCTEYINARGGYTHFKVLMKLCDFLFGQYVISSMAIVNEMHSWNKWHLFLCTGHIDRYYSVLLWCHWRFRMMLLPLKLLTLSLFWIVITTKAFWIYTDKFVNKITLFVLNRFHKDHQEGYRQMNLYDLVIMETSSMTSKMNQRGATLGDVKQLYLPSVAPANVININGGTFKRSTTLAGKYLRSFSFFVFEDNATGVLPSSPCISDTRVWRTSFAPVIIMNSNNYFLSTVIIIHINNFFCLLSYVLISYFMCLFLEMLRIK